MLRSAYKLCWYTLSFVVLLYPTVGLLYPTAALAQTADTVNIGILVDALAEESAPLADTLAAEIAAVLGPDVVVLLSPENVLVSEFDPATAQATYQAHLDSEVDIILAIGLVVGQVVSRELEFPKPTIVFGALNVDLIDLPDDRPTSGIDNFTYVVTSHSYTRDLTTLNSLVDFERVGVILPATHLQLLPISEAVGSVVSELGAEFEMIPYDGPGSLDPYLDRVDAVYLAEGTGIPDPEIRQIAETFRDRRLPSFSGARGQDVEMGFMATHQAEENLNRFFRRVALHVEAVVDGRNLSEQPIFVEFTERLAINFNTTVIVGVSLKTSLIADTDFIGDFTNPLADQRYSLRDIVDEALSENLFLAGSRRDIDLADQDVRYAWSTYLPSFSASGSGSIVDPELAESSAGGNPQYSALGTLSLQQTLFSPDANANISIRGRLFDAQRETFRAEELNLILDAGSVYFQALLMKASLRIRKENLDATNRSLTIAKQNFAAGQTGRADVLRLQSEWARDMQALLESMIRVEQAFHAINRLLNNPVDRQIDVEDALEGQGLPELLDDPSLRSSLEEFLVDEALRNAPELNAIDYNLAATDRSISLNGAQRFLPTIAAVGQYNLNFVTGGVGVTDPSIPTSANNYTLGLRASIPLFDSNLRIIDRQFTRIQYDQLRLSREDTAETIEQLVRDIMLDLVREAGNIELTGMAEDAAAEGLALTQTAYGNGAVIIVELIDAQANLLRAQLSRVTATYNFLFASMELGRFVGHFFPLASDEENQEFFARFAASGLAGGN